MIGEEEGIRLEKVSRRDFIRGLVGGFVVGAAAATAGLYIAAPEWFRRKVVETPTPTEVERVPSKPLKVGVQFMTKGGGAAWGDPTYKGAMLAIREINDAGGILGRRIEPIVKDEAGADDTVREYRALIGEGIEAYFGLISSGNTPAVAPVAEEAGLLSFFIDGCTDILFEKTVTDPRFVFRMTNIQSADGVTAALGAIKLLNLVEKDKIKIAHVHPDYAYGRNAQAHMQITFEKVLGKDRVEVVYEAWPGLFRVADFGPTITKIMESGADIVASSLWAADFINFYKQALGLGLFKRAMMVSTISHGITPSLVGSDYPEGFVAGVHANYYFLYPEHYGYPLNRVFVENYYRMWGDYPTNGSEGAYVAVYLYKAAVERAYGALGRWPEPEEIVRFIEGASIFGPAGILSIRARKPNKHQGYKNAIVGVSKVDPTYGFNILANPLRIPIERITVPEGWEGSPEPTMTYNWIRETWREGVIPI
ncbi:MAG: ABC transporter substrate-binding protein [Acidilobaceae archaeon]